MVVVADLPDEILFHQIFWRLPVKSLLCFRSVCKAWNRMICEPQFVRLHLNQQQQYSHNKLLIRTPEMRYCSVDYDEEAAGRVAGAVTLNCPPEAYSPLLVLLGSYNGLVGIAFTDNRFYIGTKLLVWNPSTRETKFVPDPDPCIRFHHKLGFAYDSNVDDYKMVHLFYTRFRCRIYMYSLRNNSWKTVKDVTSGNALPFNFSHRHGFEVNGFLYWLVRSDASCMPNPSIIGFGLRDENVTVLSMPNDMLQPKRSVTTKVTERHLMRDFGGGCIALFDFYKEEKFLVWTMKEPEKKERKWEKLITFSISSPEYILASSIRPVWFTKNGKVFLTIGFEGGDQDQHKFGVYDPQNKTLEYVQNIHGVELENSAHLIKMKVITYIESLVSPNMFGPRIRRVIGRKKRKRGSTKC